MSDLVSLIKEAAASGSLRAFTVWPTKDGFLCSVRNSQGGWNCVNDADPVAGLETALRNTLAGAGVRKRKPAEDIFG